MAKATDPNVKAAIIAALLAGQGVTEVAKQYKVDKATVSRIKSHLSESELQQLSTEKKEELGELIAGYLKQNLVTLSVQSQHFRKEAWLEKQSAENLAVLHGVLADKTLRILEAIEPVSDELGFGDTAGDGQPVSVH